MKVLPDGAGADTGVGFANVVVVVGLLVVVVVVEVIVGLVVVVMVVVIVGLVVVAIVVVVVGLVIIDVSSSILVGQFLGPDIKFELVFSAKHKDFM